MRRVRAGRLAALALLATGAVAVGTGPASASHTATVAPVTVNVKAGEFYFKLSKTSIKKPGTVKFVVQNVGETDHNFVFTTLGKTTKMLHPNQKQTITVDFKKKGRYNYICSEPRHAQQGMSGAFTVH
jgi:uncharacterized cupredoxin-like copper-binding protein